MRGRLGQIFTQSRMCKRALRVMVQSANDERLNARAAQGGEGMVVVGGGGVQFRITPRSNRTHVAMKVLR